jgi:anti-sigma factor RsiW
MNCTSCLERLTDLACGKLDEPTAASLRAHMDGCPECRHEFETLSRTAVSLDALPSPAPSHRLRAQLMADIETEKLTLRGQEDWASSIRSSAAPRRDRRFPWTLLLLQGLGACALAAFGFIAGERTATERQVADLRARVDTMGQLVEQSVLGKRTTGERIETVLTAGASAKPDERVIDGLINSLAFDSSVNVRLNALGALYAHANQDVVRAAVIACLPRESNPLMQVSMIDFLVAARAHEASPELRNLLVDSKANGDVRESARRAIDLL